MRAFAIILALLCPSASWAGTPNLGTCYPDGWCEEVVPLRPKFQNSFAIHRLGTDPRTMTRVVLSFSCHPAPGLRPLNWMVSILHALPLEGDGDKITLSIVSSSGFSNRDIWSIRVDDLIEAAEHKGSEIEAIASAPDDAIVTISDGHRGYFSFQAWTFKSHFARAVVHCRS